MIMICRVIASVSYFVFVCNFISNTTTSIHNTICMSISNTQYIKWKIIIIYCYLHFWLHCILHVPVLIITKTGQSILTTLYSVSNDLYLMVRTNLCSVLQKGLTCQTYFDNKSFTILYNFTLYCMSLYKIQQPMVELRVQVQIIHF